MYLIDYFLSLKKIIPSETVHPLLGKSTLSLTRIKGGIKTNIVPGKAEGEMDIRTIPEHDHAAIIQQARSLAQKVEGESLKISIEVLNDRPPLYTDPRTPLVTRLRRIYESKNLPFKLIGLPFYTFLY
ncbi:MAG TPA: hypothetical protein ENM97_08250 [Moorella mulderi]|nr:hypothetical protein [Moorella mulderi]